MAKNSKYFKTLTKPNSNYSDNGFMSTSVKKDVSIGFSFMGAGDKDPTCDKIENQKVVLEIQLKSKRTNGKSISACISRDILEIPFSHYLCENGVNLDYKQRRSLLFQEGCGEMTDVILKDREPLKYCYNKNIRKEGTIDFELLMSSNNVAATNDMCGFPRDEGEIIFYPGTKFKVIKIKNDQVTYNRDDVAIEFKLIKLQKL